MQKYTQHCSIMVIKTQQTIGSVERDSGEEGMERLWCGGGGGGVISWADSGEGN